MYLSKCKKKYINNDTYPNKKIQYDILQLEIVLLSRVDRPLNSMITVIEPDTKCPIIPKHTASIVIGSDILSPF